MQRTVKETRFIYARTELDNEGKLVANLAHIIVPETDPKKAYKLAAKKVGNFTPLKTETLSRLYVLDDDIFFKYAVIVGGSDGTDETNPEGLIETDDPALTADTETEE